MHTLSIYDFLITPIYMVIIYFICFFVTQKNIKEKPYYKYLTKLVFAKIFGGICVCLIYLYYYNGGDTIHYFYDGADVMRKLFFDNFGNFVNVLIEAPRGNANFWTYFNSNTGWPGYMNDNNSFFVIKITSLIGILAGGSYLSGTLLLAAIASTGIWKLFEIFVEFYPRLEGKFIYSILFFPSLIFWGSGFLKDTITLSALGWYLFSFYRLLIQKKMSLIGLVNLFVAGYIVLMIKPYIMFALLPGSLLWFMNATLEGVKNFFVKSILAPFLIILVMSLAFLGLTSMGDMLGLYKVDSVLDRAVITQQDLKREAYKGNSFDIGDYDATLGSMIAKAPLAINAALFRPYIWESKNPVMAIAGLENLYILFLTLFLIIKLKVVNIIFLIRKSSLMSFSILFALFFAFAVGISTSNFGSMVRYKIPLIPFYLSSLIILQYHYENSKNKDS